MNEGPRWPRLPLPLTGGGSGVIARQNSEGAPMRELRDLMFHWLDRIPPRKEVWHPDPQAVRLDHRQQDAMRDLAELDVYVDTIRDPRRGDESDRRAV